MGSNWGAIVAVDGVMSDVSDIGVVTLFKLRIPRACRLGANRIETRSCISTTALSPQLSDANFIRGCFLDMPDV